MQGGITVINEKVRQESAFVAALRSEIRKVIVGQEYLIDRLLVAILALGKIAWDAYLEILKQRGMIASRTPYKFAHGAEAEVAPRPEVAFNGDPLFPLPLEEGH